MTAPHERPHRRFNPLTREWVLVSPHRTKRPWLGLTEKTPRETPPAYDPACYLCPGNARAGGARNPSYESVFVFDNDFAAVLPPPEDRPSPFRSDPLLQAEPEYGLCRVVCFSPRHDLSLPELPPAQIEAVVDAWSDQTSELGSREWIRYVQIFENKGASMGCSNPHPHGQIWATGHVPNEPAKELAAQSGYLREHGRCLLCRASALETAAADRTVVSNEHFSAFVPFWAVWPFEILIVGHRHAGSLPELDRAEIRSLADILRRVTIRYDNLFETPFPYSMGFHQAPTDGEPHPEWHLHAHFYPPLLRSASVRKFMVGFEMLGMPQRDVTPESAAEQLRRQSEVHYKR